MFGRVLVRAFFRTIPGVFFRTIPGVGFYFPGGFGWMVGWLVVFRSAQEVFSALFQGFFSALFQGFFSALFQGAPSIFLGVRLVCWVGWDRTAGARGKFEHVSGGRFLQNYGGVCVSFVRHPPHLFRWYGGAAGVVVGGLSVATQLVARS